MDELPGDAAAIAHRDVPMLEDACVVEVRNGAVIPAAEYGRALELIEAVESVRTHGIGGFIVR